MLRNLGDSAERHLATLALIRPALTALEQACRTIREGLASGRKLLTCGNGGSAAEALHLSEEMVGRFHKPRAPLAAICLSSDPTALTCIANDFGYEEVFARQVQALGGAGDVLVALSTSGKSKNVLRALETARHQGLHTIGLLGPRGSPAEALCDIALTFNEENSAYIQELHLLVIHLILEQIER